MKVWIFPWFIFISLGFAAEPGLRLELVDDHAATDVRTVRQPVLFIPEQSPASPFLAPGPFLATFTGFLNLDTRSRLVFSFEGSGTAVLTLNDEVLLEVSGDDLSLSASERERLNPGSHPIRIDYTSPQRGPAQLRLFWDERSFAREPVPHRVLTHEPDERLLQASELRSGRALFAQHQCIKCHQPTGKAFDPAQVMPELLETGPDFQDIGNRFKPAWLAHWIASPKALRPTARMPELGLTVEETRDISAYLSSGSLPGKPILRKQDVNVGAALFRDLGCIACHQVSAEEAFARDVAPIPLTAVNAKYKDLSAFLLAPARHYPAIRMPDFKLSPTEADALAAYLQNVIETPIDPGVQGDVTKGKLLVQERGCLNCHQHALKNRYASPSLEAIAESDWATKGCLSADPTVQLNLQEGEQVTLLAFKAGLSSLKQRNLGEYSERQIARLNCAACHSRDGQLSQWDRIQDASPAEHTLQPGVEDTHSILARMPNLNLPGEKLKAGWMADLFAGKHAYRPRAWLDKRMPAFASRAKLLAEGVAQAAGIHDTTPEAADPKLVKMGEQLSGTKGFACVACHGIQDQKPLAVFEGQGINFAYASPRLRPEYYHRWMLNPQRLDASSIMPKYADENGMTTLPDVLGGSASNQFNAIWMYLESVQGDQEYQSK
ncbi:MAG: mono/diheme cytochrome c family protein [Verrucomicrobiales bacterium]|jgi:mono/diheme cytochrome c family protein